MEEEFDLPPIEPAVHDCTLHVFSPKPRLTKKAIEDRPIQYLERHMSFDISNFSMKLSITNNVFDMKSGILRQHYTSNGQKRNAEHIQLRRISSV